LSLNGRAFEGTGGVEEEVVITFERFFFRKR